MNTLLELIKKNRSYRRFHQEVEISKETLVELIELARFSASARNAQSIRYIISNTPQRNAGVFPHLLWAGYLNGWPGPQEGEQPSAYLIMVTDTRISDNHFCDDGIAAQSILLGAVEKGLGGCIIGSIEKVQLQKHLSIPPYYKIVMIIALGKPKEEVVLEDAVGGEIKYYRDEDGVHHVPKRLMKDLILDI